MSLKVHKLLRKIKEGDNVKTNVQILQQECKNDPSIIIFLANVYQYNLEDLRKAQQLINQALELENTNDKQIIQTYATKALLEFTKNNFDEAAEYHRKSISMSEFNQNKNDLFCCIFSVYSKQAKFVFSNQQEKSDSSYCIESYLYEIRSQKSRAFKAMLQGYQKVEDYNKKKFYLYRLHSLCEDEEQEQYINQLWDKEAIEHPEFLALKKKNDTMYEMLEFTKQLNGTNINTQLSTERVQILRRLRNIQQKYRNDEDQQKRQKAKIIKQKIQQIQDQQNLLLALVGSSTIIQAPNPKPAGKVKELTNSKKVIRQTQSQYFTGSYMMKIHFDSEGRQKRYFHVNQKQKKLYYCSTKDRTSTGNNYYTFKDLVQVVEGKTTKPFKRKENQDLDERLCFSLIFEKRSRDFYCYTKQDYQNWIEIFNDHKSPQSKKLNKKEKSQEKPKENSTGKSKLVLKEEYPGIKRSKSFKVVT